jgi:hypothetical protein
VPLRFFSRLSESVPECPSTVDHCSLLSTVQPHDWERYFGDLLTVARVHWFIPSCLLGFCDERDSDVATSLMGRGPVVLFPDM